MAGLRQFICREEFGECAACRSSVRWFDPELGAYSCDEGCSVEAKKKFRRWLYGWFPEWPGWEGYREAEEEPLYRWWDKEREVTRWPDS